MKSKILPNGEGTNLFGEPNMPVRDRRGRPSFSKTKENQRAVLLRVADGWTQDEIAEDLNCDPKTLRANFSRELKSNARAIRGELLDILMKRAREGHTPSISALFKYMSENSGQPPSKKTRSAKPPEVGKIARRLIEAGEPEVGYDDLYSRIRQQ